MAITRWDAVVDAVIGAVSTQVAGTADVYDGPPNTSEPLTDAIIIGAVNGETVSGTLDQEWRTMGGPDFADRDENGTVRCMAVAQRGDTEMATTRAAAVTLLGQVETALRTVVSYDYPKVYDNTDRYDSAGTVASEAATLWIQLQAGSVAQLQTPAGSECWITFTLAYRAII